MEFSSKALRIKDSTVTVTLVAKSNAEAWEAFEHIKKEIARIESQPDPQAMSHVTIKHIPNGRRIDCIKIVREHMGMGLKEAKDSTDVLPHTFGPMSESSGRGFKEHLERFEMICSIVVE